MTNDTVDLVEISQELWSARLQIFVITTVFTVAAAVYSLVATEWYQADVLLAPTEESTAHALTNPLSGFASLAGINLGSRSTVEPVAVLKSRTLARQFIEQQGLTPLLAEQIGTKVGQNPDGDPDDTEISEVVRFFDENMRRVTEDPKTGLVKLSIRWTDSDMAAEWANAMVEQLNERMRKRALDEAQDNIAYLRKELAGTSVVTLQQSVSRILELEMQKLMLARGNKEYSFRVIDPAVPPKFHTVPRRKLIVGVAVALGIMISFIFVFFRRGMQRLKAEV